ncbi:MAG: ATP-binding protein [Spirochaetales bacterium]
MREKIQGNIANALIRRIVLVGVVLIVLSTVVSVGIEYTRQRQAMQETAERIGRVDVVPIQEALWVADEYMLELLLEALVRDPFVGLAEVIDGGTIVASAGNQSDGPVQPMTYIMTYEFDGTQRFLGRLRLELDLAPVWSSAFVLGLAGALYPIVVILGVGLVLFVSFHRTVVNPLVYISDYLQSFSVNYEPRRLELPREGRPKNDDELDEIANAVNTLRDSLNHRYQQLLDSNRRTEIKVDEKTRELQLANETLHREIAELEKTKDELSAANQAKTLFLANISHEIRTPITGVVGLARLLSNTSLDDEQHGYTDAIVSSASSLLEIVEDLLDFSKLEAKKIELQPEPFDPKKSVMMVVSLLGSAVENNHTAIDVEFGPDVPDLCIGDSVRVQQVLRNLLSNAVKFTPDGRITISLGLVAQGQAGARLRFTVADTGIGIPADVLDRLFESFYQVDSSYSKDFKGAGLGLSISKHLVELMGGELGVESTLDVGSTFWFEIPCQLSRTEPITESGSAGSVQAPRGRVTQLSERAAPDRCEARVLLAEDNAINRFYIESLLRRSGCTVTAVADGNAVMEALEHGTFDVILMDIQMPGMDGIETTHEVRKRRDIPIIALTAYARQSELESFLEAGMDAAVTKPIDEEELLRVISEHSPATA